MKYIYFDCYAGFDLQMALGALIDMSDMHGYAEKVARDIVPGAQLFCENVKRQSMDAVLAYFDISAEDDGDIYMVADSLCTDEKTKARLKRWLTIKDDKKRHSFNDELRELVYCAVCLEIIKNLEAEKIYTSSVGQGSGVVQNDGNIEFIPSKHTELLAKMSGIPTVEINANEEILTASALSFLYVLGAEHIPPRAHNVIKSGYGAGAKHLAVPNIARCILAKDDSDDVGLGFECVFSEFASEYACEMKK